MPLIIKFKLYFAVVLLLVLHTTASSTFYIPQLLNWSAKQVAPYQHLYSAAVQGSEVATENLYQLSAADEIGHYWQVKLAELGNAKAQYRVANQAIPISEKRYWLRQAAQQGHPPSIYQLALLENNSSQKTLLLERAAGLGYFPAMKTLYQWYWMQQDYGNAEPWLEQVAKREGYEAKLLGLYLWRQQREEQAISWLEHALLLGEPNARNYLDIVSEYWHKPQSTALAIAREDCSMRLQFVASSLDSMRQAKEFQQTLAADEGLEGLPICVNEIYWPPSQDFSCDNEARNRYRITCDLAGLAENLEPGSFTHLVVFADTGKANVRNGVMFLDLADTYSIFVHELAHFVGFIDEYPLSDELASYYCGSQQNFPNIAVITPEQSIDDIDLSYWQSYGESLSLVKARTCNNHENQAYKFTSEMTFLEFHDSYTIPPLYYQIWKKRLADKSYQLPAAINIAQALEEVGNSPAAQIWWQSYQDWLGQ